METTVSQLLLTDPKITTLLIGAAFGVFWFVLKNWNSIKLPFQWLKALYERTKKKEDLLNMLLDDNKELKRVSDEVNTYKENRIHDREQSFAIQKEWTDRIEALFVKLDENQKRTDARFADMEEKNNKRVRAELKDKIGASYRYYHAKGEINDMELEALEDLIQAYEDAKGENSFVHSVVQKEMYTWKLVERI